MNGVDINAEAKFQDDKIVGNTSRDEGKFYRGPASRYRIEAIQRILGDVNGKRILEIGAGDGWNTLHQLKRGAYVYSVDISPESIKHIERVTKDYSDRYKGFVMDARRLAFEDNSFDIVIGHGILHHLLNFESTIPEILRVLKPDGKAVFSEPLGMNPVINLYRKLTPGHRTILPQIVRTAQKAPGRKILSLSGVAQRERRHSSF